MAVSAALEVDLCESLVDLLSACSPPVVCLENLRFGVFPVSVGFFVWPSSSVSADSSRLRFFVEPALVVSEGVDDAFVTVGALTTSDAPVFEREAAWLVRPFATLKGANMISQSTHPGGCK